MSWVEPITKGTGKITNRKRTVVLITELESKKTGNSSFRCSSINSVVSTKWFSLGLELTLL